MYDFDTFVDRRGTHCCKWDGQFGFGQKDGLLPFWIADTDFAAEPKILEAMTERLKHPCMGYCDTWNEVYEAVAGWWERRHNWRPETEWMFAAGGVVTTMYLNLMDLLPDGGKILLFTPVYDSFFPAIRNSFHEVAHCEMNYSDGYYTINWEDFEEQLRGGEVKGVIFCNPHNPVGRVWTEDEVKRVCELCAKYDVYLFSDEVHCDYHRYHDYTPAGKFECIWKKLIVYTAISKSFNMAGMEASVLIIPDPELRASVQEKFYGRYMFNPTELAMIATQTAYNCADTWMDEANAYVNANAEYVEKFLAERMPKVTMAKHEGTFLLWLDMRCYGLPSNDLMMIMAKEYGLAVASGSQYLGDGFMRFNIGCARCTLEKGMEKLAEMYDRYIVK